MDDFEIQLQRELQRVAGEARGPAPRAAQARYRKARPSMLVISKLAVGAATVALALSASVVAAAAFSGSRPTDWGHAVKVVVDRCIKVEHARNMGRMHWLGFNTGVVKAQRETVV